MTSQNGHPAKPETTAGPDLPAKPGIAAEPRLVDEPSDQLVELMTRYHQALAAGAAPPSAALPGDGPSPALDAAALQSDLLETAVHDADSLDADSRAQFERAKNVLERLARVSGELTAADRTHDLDFFTALASFATLLGSEPQNGDAHGAEMRGVAQLSEKPTDAAGVDLPRVTAARKFGRFEILRELGRGGLGVVFLAHDPVLNRQVAIKIPRPEALMTPDLRMRFSREAQAAARLTHPHLVSVYEVGEVGPICYIASAFVEGPNLAIWLRGCRPAPTARQAAAIVAVLADAMQYAHQHGVLHRDLKPSNVLLEPACQPSGGDSTSGGIEFTPKITDFGLAKLAEGTSDFTRTGLVLGTPAYMAPEQAHGKLNEIDARTDVYGLGAILFELLTGHPPCAGSSEADTLRRVVTDEPTFRGEALRALPADLRAIALKCLEKEPRRRYQSAGDLAADLRRFLAGQPTQARPLGPMGRATKWARRRPTAAALAIVSCAAAVSLLAGSLYYSVRTTRLFNVAERHRHEAEENQESLRRYLYAADMPLAQKAYQRNNLAQVQQLLSRHIPESGEEDLRGFPWYFLDQLTKAERLKLSGHQGDVYTVLYSPDGKLLFSSGKDGTVRLWDAADGHALCVLAAHQREVNTIALSPDGSQLASAGDDHTVGIWSVPRALAQSTNSIAATQAALLDRIEFSHPTRAVAFSPDSKSLATAAGHSIDLFTLPERKPLRSIETTEAVTSLVFSRDGKFVYGTTDTTVRKWDAATGQELATSGKQMRGLVTLAQPHDGRHLISASISGQVSWWDADTLAGNPIWKRQVGRVDAVAFSPDDKLLAIGGGKPELVIWNLASDQRLVTLRGHLGAIWSTTFSPDGAEVATCSADGTVRVWEARSTNPRLLNSDRGVSYFCLAFSPDGRILAAGRATGQIELWDWANSKQLLTLSTQGHADDQATSTSLGVFALAFSPDGRQLAAHVGAGFVQLWDVSSGQLVGELVGNRIPGGLSFSPDGRLLAVGATHPHFGDCARIWDLAARHTPLPIPQLSSVAELQFLPRTPLLAAISPRHRSVQLLQSTSLQLEHGFSFGPNAMACASVSADGQLCATGGDAIDRTVRIWDMTSGECLGSLVGHEADICNLLFLPDGRTLASASADGTVRLWDLYSGQESLVLAAGAPGWRIICATTSDGRALAYLGETAEGDKQLTVVSASKPTAGSRQNRPNPEERANLARPAPSDRAFPLTAKSEGYFEHREFPIFRDTFALVQDHVAASRQVALPTFEEQTHDGIVHHGALLLSLDSGAELWTGVCPQLNKFGEIPVRHILGALNDGHPLPKQAGAACYICGAWGVFPRSWKLLLFPQHAVEKSTVAAADIGLTDDLLERFRRVHRWAKGHGYAGGFPTFNDGEIQGAPSYGVVLIKPGMGEEVWVPVK
jgi:WD40 repeat protein/serine/threonine protein kinase